MGEKVEKIFLLNDLRKIFDRIETDLKIDVPDKYRFKLEGKIMRIDEWFDTQSNEPIKKVYEVLKYMTNLEDHSIDMREFFSIARALRDDQDKIEKMRLKNKVKRKGEKVNQALAKYGIKTPNDEIVNEGEYDNEIDIFEDLKEEVIYALERVEEEKKFVKFVEDNDVSMFDFYDSVSEKEQRIISFNFEGLEPKEIFDRIATSERIFYCRLTDREDYIKVFVNDQTKKILTDDSVNEKNEDNMILCKFYPLDVSKQYVIKAVVDVEIDLYTGFAKLNFNNYKDMSVERVSKMFYDTFNFFKAKTSADIPLTSKYIINGFQIDRVVMMDILFHHFPNNVYVDESKDPFFSKSWLRFYLVYKKNKISITMNNKVINKPMNVRKEGLYRKLPDDSEIVKITISNCQSQEGLDVTRNLIYKCLTLYLNEYHGIVAGYQEPTIKFRVMIPPQIIKIKATKLKELIPGFNKGGNSRQGKKERLKLNIIDEEEAMKLREEGYTVMLFPPPNMRKMFKIKFDPFFIGPSKDDKYIYHGLKKNSTLEGDINSDNFPYIPMYFSKKNVEIAPNFNVEFKVERERNIQNSKSDDKDLMAGEKGELKDDIKKIIQHKWYIERLGFPQGKDNLINAIQYIFGEKIVIDPKEKVRPYWKQELFDVDVLPEVPQYETYHKVLEYMTGYNIYCFEVVGGKIKLVIPRHKDFFVPEAVINDECIVLFRNKVENYELLLPKDKEGHDVYTFNREVNERLHQLLIYLTATKDIQLFDINEIFTTIKSQSLSIDGKLRSVNIIEDGVEQTVLTPPLHPLKLPLTTIVKKLKIQPNSKRDNKGIGIEFEREGIKFRGYPGQDISNLPINDMLIFENPAIQSVVDTSNKIKARILKQVFGVFLLLSKDPRFVDKYCVVKEGHQYKIEYDLFKVNGLEDINNVKLPSYIKGGKIILDSENMKEKFRKLSIVLLRQFSYGDVVLTQKPYIFKKRFFNITDFSVKHTNEYIFSSLHKTRLFLYEKRTEMENIVHTRLPDIIAADFQVKKETRTEKNDEKIKQKQIVYPSKYNLPVDPILYFDGSKYYWIQYVKDVVESKLQLRTVKSLLYNWEIAKVNTGYYTNNLIDTSIETSYPILKPEKDGTIKPNGQICVLEFKPIPTVKVNRPLDKFAAILPL